MSFQSIVVKKVQLLKLDRWWSVSQTWVRQEFFYFIFFIFEKKNFFLIFEKKNFFGQNTFLLHFRLFLGCARVRYINDIFRWMARMGSLGCVRNLTQWVKNRQRLVTHYCLTLNVWLFCVIGQWRALNKRQTSKYYNQLIKSAVFTTNVIYFEWFQC